MSLVVLHHTDTLTVASDRLVYGAHELPAFESASELASHLDDLVATTSDRLASAERDAHERGFSLGEKAGFAAGQKRLANTLLDAARTLERQKDEVRADAIRLALGIVRRIAGELGDDAMLAAMAATAAQELLPGDRPVLSVHPDRLEGVRERLPADVRQRLVSLRADPSLGPLECVIETPQGAVVADLDAQLAALENQLDDR